MILVINCGSSSLKYELYQMKDEKSLASGLCERVGINSGADAKLKHNCNGRTLQRSVPMPDHGTALGFVIEALVDTEYGVIEDLSDIKACGHRVLHGGSKITDSVVVDDQVIAVIKEMSVLGPLHNPANLSGILACMKLLPATPQVAVFDTAFHQTMPRHAFLYGLPYEMYEDHQIRRYGFHGTSHRYISMVASQMLEERGIALEDQRVITCHLGNGCSMAAIKAGKVQDTSMGLTPLEGLLMGTRCGDLDPAIVVYLAEKLGFTPPQMDSYMNKKSGLLGVSGISSDMRDIQDNRENNQRADDAYMMFCYRVRKYIGAYAAAIGGVDAVIFSAGIGENDPPLRADCVEGLNFLGLEIDDEKNNAPKRKDVPGWEIGKDGAAARIFIIPTDEELMIARDTVRLVGGNGD
ncbi:MAG: acetate/propionate family kinase [Armatimonadota bacterium]